MSVPEPFRLIAAAQTPMQPDGSLWLDQVPTLVDHLVRQQLWGIFPLGSTGEGASLTVAERRTAAAAFVAAAEGRLKVVIHVGHQSPREAQGLARHAQDVGADAIAAVAPSYFKPDSVEALLDSLTEIAAGAPDLPFYYYHIPHLTGVDLDVATVLERAAMRVPTLVGVKYTAPTLPGFQAAQAAADGRYELLFGTDEMLLGALAVGARGAVGSTYNFAAPLYHRLIAAFDRGDMEDARRCQLQAVAMVRVLQRFPGFTALKETMRLVGVDCGPVRPPLRPLTSAQRKSLEEGLAEIGFFEWSRAEPVERALLASEA